MFFHVNKNDLFLSIVSALRFFRNFFSLYFLNKFCDIPPSGLANFTFFRLILSPLFKSFFKTILLLIIFLTLDHLCLKFF